MQTELRQRPPRPGGAFVAVTAATDCCVSPQSGPNPRAQSKKKKTFLNTRWMNWEDPTVEEVSLYGLFSSAGLGSRP